MLCLNILRIKVKNNINKLQKVTLPDGSYIFQLNEGQKISSDNEFINAEVVKLYIEHRQQSLRCLELGSGNGINIFMLAKTFSKWCFTGIELDDSLVSLARENRTLQEAQCKFKHADIKHYNSNEKYDIIISNPPFRKLGTGRLSASYISNIAKFELKCSMQDVIKCVACNLNENGNAYLLYPKDRMNEIEENVARNELNIESTIYNNKLVLVRIKRCSKLMM